MAYESPISVWWSDTKIEQLRDEYNNLIVRAVKNVCPNVDKDELIKALEYDRGQYEKGFADGLSFKPPVKSNADRIRTMTDEELADKFEEVQLQTVKAYGNDHLLLKGELRKYWLDWLRQEAEE